jgi:hypothetical protein
MTLAELEAKRAARKDVADLPHTMTRGEVDAYIKDTALLDRRLTQARDAIATLALLQDPDPEWWERLKTWRQTLADELLRPIPEPTPKDLAARRNLTLSILVCDRGPGVLKDSDDYDLQSLRLGALMRADGFEPEGSDPIRAYSGVMPWHGSLKDLERQAKDVARRRRQAQAALDAALLDDDERERQEAEARELNAAYNQMRVLVNADGGLRVVSRDGDAVDESGLTPLQRRALARAREVFRGELAVG